MEIIGYNIEACKLNKPGSQSLIAMDATRTPHARTITMMAIGVLASLVVGAVAGITYMSEG